MNGHNSAAEGRALAFLCGALMGASAALLLAPLRGSEMRAQIGETAKQSRERMRRYREAGSEWAHDRLSRAGEVSRTAVHRASEAVDQAVDRAQSAVNQGAAKAHEVTERARTAITRGAESARAAARDVDQAVADATPDVRQRDPWS
jgi:gas vesicle protein